MIIANLRNGFAGKNTICFKIDVNGAYDEVNRAVRDKALTISSGVSKTKEFILE